MLEMEAEGAVSADPPADPWSWEDGSAPFRKKQGELSQKLEDTSLGELVQAASQANKARVCSCGGPGAGAWLSAIPADPGLSLSDEAFSTAVRFRLGHFIGFGI